MVTHRRGPWSTSEDAYLLQLVQQDGAHNWVRISQLIQTRSPKQCRERYHQNLKPSLNHDPITPEEGELIERLVSEMGRKWAEIARRLHGRSDNAVKNWWNGGQNRRKRSIQQGDSSRRATTVGAFTSRHHPYAPQPGQEDMAVYSPPRVGSIYQVPSTSYSDEGSEGASYYQHPPRSASTGSPARHLPPLNMLSAASATQFPAHSGSLSAGSRPTPLDLKTPIHRSRGYDTPAPSPSGVSVISADGAPSLITDYGSESRSPHLAPSPSDFHLPPLIGTAQERRRSSVRILPHSGFAPDDDEHLSPLHLSVQDEKQRRASLQLPPLPQGHSLVPPSANPSPIFREPNYNQGSSDRQMLSQPSRPTPLRQASYQQPPSSGLSLQRPLPAFSTLADACKPSEAPRSPKDIPQPSIERSVPCSPVRQPPSPRDERMNVSKILV